jgi:hypothetical protein
MPELDPSSRARTSIACRAGLAAALLGIASGAVLSVTLPAGTHAADSFDLFSVPPFAPWMLAPILLGSVAAVLAIVDIVQRDGRYRRPLFAFCLGLAAIATPFFFKIVVGVCVAVLAIMILVSIGS